MRGASLAITTPKDSDSVATNSQTWVAGKHTSQERSLKNSTAPIIIIGDLIAAGLGRYERVWRNYFEDTLKN